MGSPAPGVQVHGPGPPRAALEALRRRRGPWEPEGPPGAQGAREAPRAPAVSPSQRGPLTGAWALRAGGLLGLGFPGAALGVRGALRFLAPRDPGAHRAGVPGSRGPLGPFPGGPLGPQAPLGTWGPPGLAGEEKGPGEGKGPGPLALRRPGLGFRGWGNPPTLKDSSFNAPPPSIIPYQ